MLTGTNSEGNTPRISPEKSLGATPMIVKMWPFNRSVRPTTSWLPEKSRCQAA
jgi:hypothetical protein